MLLGWDVVMTKYLVKKLKVTPSGSIRIQHFKLCHVKCHLPVSLQMHLSCFESQQIRPVKSENTTETSTLYFMVVGCFFCPGVKIHVWSGQVNGCYTEKHEFGKGKKLTWTQTDKVKQNMLRSWVNSVSESLSGNMYFPLLKWLIVVVFLLLLCNA